MQYSIGDEVGAVVFDAGHHSFRAGFAGEEFPKVDMPAVVGVQLKSGDGDAANGNNVTANKSAKQRQFAVQPTQWQAPIAGQEVQSYMHDGMVGDWDAFDEVLGHVYGRCLGTESKNHPLFMSEPAVRDTA